MTELERQAKAGMNLGGQGKKLVEDFVGMKERVIKRAVGRKLQEEEWERKDLSLERRIQLKNSMDKGRKVDEKLKNIHAGLVIVKLKMMNRGNEDAKA